MTKSRTALLTELLRTMLAEWGPDKVQQTLTELSDANLTARNSSSQSDREGSTIAPRARNRSRRLTASEQVARASNVDERRKFLVQIAEKFDSRRFLPTIGDAREFLAMMGQDAGNLKDRSDAFRLLVAPLAELPTEMLEHLAKGSSYSGPSQLGPLSEAIRSTGEVMRRGEKVSGS